MTNYELEEYIKNNIDKILESYINHILTITGCGSTQDILEIAEDLVFIKNFKDKYVEATVLNVKDQLKKIEEKIEEIPF